MLGEKTEKVSDDLIASADYLHVRGEGLCT